MRILNLTQHLATTEQVAEGVVDLPEKERKALIGLLTFNSCPKTRQELKDRAYRISSGFAIENPAFVGFAHAMIGGAPALMPFLERALEEQGIVPLYSFSERVSEDVHLPDGSVKKVATFRHAGWWPTE